jgi:hypothetical protein
MNSAIKAAREQKNLMMDELIAETKSPKEIAIMQAAKARLDAMTDAEFMSYMTGKRYR